MTGTHFNHDQIKQLKKNWLGSIFFCPGDSLDGLPWFIRVLKVSLRLTLMQHGGLCHITLFPLMTNFSVLMPLQGITPKNSWLGSISLKDYKRDREREREEIILKDFNCTMKKMGRKGRSKTQRLYRCDPNYTLSKVIVDNGLEYF